MPQFFHGRGFRVLVHDADLSCYFSEATASYEVETAETTTFCDAARTYIPGVTDGTLSLSGLWDGSPRGIDELMRDRIAIEPETVVSLFPSNYLTVGRRVDLFSAHQTSLEISGAVGSVVSLSADFQGSGPSRPGYILAAHTLRTSDVTEPSVDTGADYDTPAGAALVSQVHVTTNARTSPTTRFLNSRAISEKVVATSRGSPAVPSIRKLVKFS